MVNSLCRFSRFSTIDYTIMVCRTCVRSSLEKYPLTILVPPLSKSLKSFLVFLGLSTQGNTGTSASSSQTNSRIYTKTNKN
jgi:hypothetical protein